MLDDCIPATHCAATSLFSTEATRILQASPDNAPALIDLVITSAADAGASDIHLDPTESCVEVRLRRDGVLQPLGTLPQEKAANLVARCKVIARLLSYRTDIPQEGGASGAAYADGLELRISTFPTVHGERVAIRLFHAAHGLCSLDELGFSDASYSSMTQALSRSEGMVLLSGPCGSGKTTTLYAALRHILSHSNAGRSIITIEDPVENRLPGITQTSIRPAVGLTFARSLSSLLRQDPEVLMVGEIRDRETASIAAESALTGHLLLSTVHASRAGLVPHRLLDMGVEPYALAGALQIAIAQRLLRRLCPHCKSAAPDNQSGFLPTGCEKCNKTGYSGRMLLAEHVVASDALHDAIMDVASRRRFMDIVATQTATLPAQATACVQNGISSHAEIMRVLAGELE